jgi:hypothetical protein
MPRDGAIMLGDLIGKHGTVRVECAKCGRSGQYRLSLLIAKYRRDAKLFDWPDELTAGCPRKRARDINDQCGACGCGEALLQSTLGRSEHRAW